MAGKTPEDSEPRSGAPNGPEASSLADPSLPEEYQGATVIQQGPAPRAPGLTARRKRVLEWIYLTKLSLLRNAEREAQELSDSEAQRQAEKAYDELGQGEDRERVWKIFEETEPTSRAPVRDEIDGDVEIAAALWHPLMRWFQELMLRKTNARGFAAKRRLVLAVFVRLAFALGRPEITRHRETLLRGNTLASWAHGYPDDGPGRKHFFESMHRMLENKPAAVMNHINVALLRELAERKDKDGNPVHPRIGRVAAVDGTLIPACVEQRSPVDEIHRGLLFGDGREGVSDVVYKDSKGRVRNYCVGYKLMALVDLATTLPIVFCVIPADGDERKAARYLIELLFELWPECSLDTVVADALYDNDRSFAHWLVFQMGISPCFPKHGVYDKKLAHVETDGVPVCACKELMKLHDTDRFYTAARRAKEGIPRGEEAGLDARLRWKCVNGLCKMKYTRPFDDPRLYTYLPRGGNHTRALTRIVYLLRRNAVESVFASLKHLGIGGKAQERPAWAKDAEMDWLLSAGLVFLTARRVAHESGHYTLALAEAGRLGLLEQPTRVNPAPGPDEFTLARIERERWNSVGEPRAPETWLEDRSSLAELPAA